MTKEATIYNWEKQLSSINGVGKSGWLYAKEWNWTSNLHHIQKLTQNGIKDLNVWPETIKFLEENIGGDLLSIGLRDIYFGSDSTGKDNKSKNKQMGLHQTKRLLCERIKK